MCDALGYNLDMVVGGTSSEYIEDFEGPQIELFMNDTNFVFGGITDANPSLLLSCMMKVVSIQ